MKIVCVNYTFDHPITKPDVLLDHYETLVGWANGLKLAGAQVLVVQRFGSDTEMTLNGVRFRFIHDPTSKEGSIFDRPLLLNTVVVEAQPDIVHVNGLQFAHQAWQLKRMLKNRIGSRKVPILLQDHASPLPRLWLNRWPLARALHQMDAVSFVSREQAIPWRDAGLLRPGQPIIELMEGSSNFVLKPQDSARAKTGLTGDPLCLWVGRLDSNKDPLTVLRGFAQAQPSLPNARLAMVYGEDNLLPEIQRWLAENLSVSGQVFLLGKRPHSELEDIYNSADLFLLGSHHEGSGYAVLEALACGVKPVITGIPSFRVLTGEGAMGGLWRTGDSESLARVLQSEYSSLHPGTRDDVRTFFDCNFHWSVIGRRAIKAYGSLTT